MDAVLRRFGYVGLCLLMCLACAAVSAAETISGTVSEYRRGPCPRGNCEWLQFKLTTSDGVVTAEMQKKLIRGTVFIGHRVEVEGKWERKNWFKADKVSDLDTGATVEHESPSLRYRVDQRLRFTGVVDGLQDVKPPMPGQINKEETLYFVLLVQAARPSDKDLRVSCIMADRRIRAFLSPGQTIVVDGKWDKRNTLRVDAIQDAKLGTALR